MRSRFLGYYPRNEEELTDLWGRGRIVFDTRSLLAMFRYTASTRDEFFNILDGFEDRLWIPHHVGLEFHRNRHEVLHEQTVAFSSVTKVITTAFAAIETAIAKYDRHPSMEATDLRELARSKRDELVAAVEVAGETHASDIEGTGVNDEVLSRITSLFSDVGEPYEPSRLAQVVEEAGKRYEKKVPPGYMDAGKKNDNEHGDYIIWRQILDLVEQDPTPIIFVTDDQKEDWWLEVHGQTKGPRPELVQEFAVACGERLHLYTSKNFIKVARERKNQAVQEEAVREVGAIAAMDRVEAEYLQRMEAKRREGQSSLADTRAAFERLMAPRYTDGGELTLYSEALAGGLDEINTRLDVISSILDGYRSDESGEEHYSRPKIDGLLREQNVLEVRQRQLSVERDLVRQNEALRRLANGEGYVRRLLDDPDDA